MNNNFHMIGKDVQTKIHYFMIQKYINYFNTSYKVGKKSNHIYTSKQFPLLEKNTT